MKIVAFELKYLYYYKLHAKTPPVLGWGGGGVLHYTFLILKVEQSATLYFIIKYIT